MLYFECNMGFLLSSLQNAPRFIRNRARSSICAFVYQTGTAHKIYRAIENTQEAGKFLDRLNHRFGVDLDLRYCSKSEPGLDFRDDHPCYVIASEDKFDQRVIEYRDLETTLCAALFGIIVSLEPGRLSVYKDEAPSDLIWLKRE